MGKVRIDESKNEMHRMYAWTYAYRQSRKCNWEEMYLDRLRFKNRISYVNDMLHLYLSSEFRNKIFHERFKYVMT